MRRLFLFGSWGQTVADDASLNLVRGQFWPHVLFVSVVLAVAVYAVEVPEYNWDVVGYTGAALQPEYSSVADLHRAAFNRLRASVPDSKFHELAPDGEDYRGIVASDPHSFLQQIPFYSSKPLYVALIRLASMAGVEVVRAPGAVSAAAATGIAFVVYFWIGCYCTGLIRVLITLVGCFVLGIPALARLASPDALSTFIVISAVSLAALKGRPLAGAILLPLSLFARSDNLIFGLFLAGAYLYTWKGVLRERTSLVAVYMVFLVFIYLAVTRFWPSYGHQTLFYHTFVAKLTYPASAAVSLTALDYAKAVLGGVKMSIFSPFNMSLWILVLIGIATMSRRPAPSTESRLVFALIWSSLAAACVHFLLLPVADGRFYLAEAFVAALLWLGASHPSEAAGGLISRSCQSETSA